MRKCSTLILMREGGVGNGRGEDEGLDDDGRSVRVDFGALLEPFTIRIRERQTDTVYMGHDQLLLRPSYILARYISRADRLDTCVISVYMYTNYDAL